MMYRILRSLSSRHRCRPDRLPSTFATLAVLVHSGNILALLLAPILYAGAD